MRRIFILAVLAVLVVLCGGCEKESFYAGYAVQNIDAIQLYFPKAENTKWDDGTVKIAKVTALFVNFGALQEAKGVEISCSTDDTYFVLPMLGGEQIGKFTLPV